MSAQTDFSVATTEQHMDEDGYWTWNKSAQHT
jgi:hypothetical protein